MDDFLTLEKTIVRELSCRLCLCNDVVKLKPLSAEVKRKLKKLFDIVTTPSQKLFAMIVYNKLHSYIYTR
ncbi:unnamed protein product [Leptidea sinapis]|uniref:Uncharacterized protein n=1 Tax=Leptidea sinapis TaxID=189913 RepID=A0A5E4QC90_9NEOP|nr:unnamed protein product [Leptidea sinapis]